MTMHYTLPLLIYVGLCLLVAVMGRKTRIGYWGNLILCILLTPFIMFLMLLFLERRRDKSSGKEEKKAAKQELPAN